MKGITPGLTNVLEFGGDVGGEVSTSEIVLAPGSARPVSLALLSATGTAIDFTVGTWSARIVIVEYPNFIGTPFAVLGTVGIGATYPWLSLNSASELVLVADPDVTSDWHFTRYHYECYIKGPNPSSKPDRVGHGPFKMDW